MTQSPARTLPRRNSFVREILPPLASLPACVNSGASSYNAASANYGEILREFKCNQFISEYKGPIKKSNWIIPKLVLASNYRSFPINENDEKLHQLKIVKKNRKILKKGISTFAILEHSPYFNRTVAQELGVQLKKKAPPEEGVVENLRASNFEHIVYKAWDEKGKIEFTCFEVPLYSFKPLAPESLEHKRNVVVDLVRLNEFTETIMTHLANGDKVMLHCDSFQYLYYQNAHAWKQHHVSKTYFKYLDLDIVHAVSCILLAKLYRLSFGESKRRIQIYYDCRDEHLERQRSSLGRYKVFHDPSIAEAVESIITSSYSPVALSVLKTVARSSGSFKKIIPIDLLEFPRTPSTTSTPSSASPVLHRVLSISSSSSLPSSASPASNGIESLLSPNVSPASHASPSFGTLSTVIPSSASSSSSDDHHDSHDKGITLSLRHTELAHANDLHVILFELILGMYPQANITTLDLSYCGLGQFNLAISVFFESWESIKENDVELVNIFEQLQVQKMQMLAKFLRIHNEQITKPTPAVAEVLHQTGYTGIHEVILDGNEITDEGAEFLIEMLTENFVLTSISLNDNPQLSKAKKERIEEALNRNRLLAKSTAPQDVPLVNL